MNHPAPWSIIHTGMTIDSEHLAQIVDANGVPVLPCYVLESTATQIVEGVNGRRER